MLQTQKVLSYVLASGMNVYLADHLVPPEQKTNLEGMRWNKGMLSLNKFFYNHRQIPSPIYRLAVYERLDGTEELLAFTNAGIYGDNNTLRSNYVANIGYLYFTDWPGLLIFTDGNQYVKKYDGATVTDLGNLPTIQTTGKIVQTFQSHVLLMNTIEAGNPQPVRVRWSHTGNPEEWVSGNAGFVDLVDTPEQIVGCMELLGRMFIYKEYSIWEMVYVGYPVMFQVAPVIIGKGLISPRALIKVRDIHYFAGRDGLYMFNGRDIEPFGLEIKEFLFGRRAVCTTPQLKNLSMVYVAEEDEIWVSVPTSLSNTGYDETFVYHIQTNMWSRRQIRKDTTIGYFSDGVNIWQEFDASWEDDSNVDWISGPNYSWEEDVNSDRITLFAIDTLIYRFTLDGGFNINSIGTINKTKPCVIDTIEIPDTVRYSHIEIESKIWALTNEGISDWYLNVYYYENNEWVNFGTLNQSTYPIGFEIPNTFSTIKFTLNKTLTATKFRIEFMGQHMLIKSISVYGNKRVRKDIT